MNRLTNIGLKKEDDLDSKYVLMELQKIESDACINDFLKLERCVVEIGYEDGRNQLRPPIRLVIRPLQSTGKKPISINRYVLSDKDVSWLLEVLAPPAEEAQLR